VCFFFLSLSLSLLSSSDPSLSFFFLSIAQFFPSEELNNLQTNVEFLTNRINTNIASNTNNNSFNYTPTSNDVLPVTITEPIYAANDVYSSPPHTTAAATTFSQPEHHDDIVNYTSNDPLPPPSSSYLSDTLVASPKTLTRSSSIKYNDADDEPVYFNEPATYSEQPGKDQSIS